jgi:hypothetical protein
MQRVEAPFLLRIGALAWVPALEFETLSMR